MPLRIEPCVPLLAKEAPRGDRWIHEIKWDGYRVMVHIQPDRVRILSRNGNDWTKRFPSIVAAAESLRPATMILDGEAVVLDEQGRSDFGLLQHALGGQGGKRNAGAALLYAFDLLYLNGHDLRPRRLRDRRIMLEEVLHDQQGAILLSQATAGDGPALFEAACDHGLEGIVSKDVTKPYHSGRSNDWLKIKCVQRDKFLIIGYEPSAALPTAIGRLLLAARKGDQLVYVGSVGTGWSNRMSFELKQLLDLIHADEKPVAHRRKGAIFTQPLLVAEIEYRAWTKDNKLRHPSFKGVDQATEEVEIYSLGE
jgi:bifunctional non-homologous end joining protein LigD